MVQTRSRALARSRGIAEGATAANSRSSQRIQANRASLVATSTVTKLEQLPRLKVVIPALAIATTVAKAASLRQATAATQTTARTITIPPSEQHAIKTEEVAPLPPSKSSGTVIANVPPKREQRTPEMPARASVHSLFAAKDFSKMEELSRVRLTTLMRLLPPNPQAVVSRKAVALAPRNAPLRRAHLKQQAPAPRVPTPIQAVKSSRRSPISSTRSAVLTTESDDVSCAALRQQLSEVRIPTAPVPVAFPEQQQQQQQQQEQREREAAESLVAIRNAAAPLFAPVRPNARQIEPPSGTWVSPKQKGTQPPPRFDPTAWSFTIDDDSNDGSDGDYEDDNFHAVHGWDFPPMMHGFAFEGFTMAVCRQPWYNQELSGLITEIKEKSTYEPALFMRFVQIMAEYHHYLSIDRKEMYDSVSLLFAGHLDLLTHFRSVEPQMKNMPQSLIPRRPRMIGPGVDLSMVEPASLIIHLSLLEDSGSWSD